MPVFKTVFRNGRGFTLAATLLVVDVMHTQTEVAPIGEGTAERSYQMIA